MTEPVRIAVVGAGLVGRWHIDAVRSLKGTVELHSIVDPSPKVRDYAQGLGTPWYASLSELLASSPPDGAVISTPNQMHAENGLECAAAGCPMLIEKPIATSSMEAKTIVEAAAAKGVPVLVGHHRRHNPLIQKARSLIDEGILGRIATVHGTCWLLKPDDYFAPEWRRKRGAGPVLVNAAHDVDLLRYLCGDVESVHAMSSNAVRGFETEDSAAAVLRFRSGAIGTLTISDTVASPWSWELTSGENPVYPKTRESCYWIGGTKGALSVPDMRYWSHGGGGHWKTDISEDVYAVEMNDPLIAQISHFAAVIRGEAEPLVSGEEGLKSLAVVEAVQRSASQGIAIPL